MRRHLFALAAGLVLASSALAQTATDDFVVRDYAFDSAAMRGAGDGQSHIVRVDGAPWLRLTFRAAELPAGTKLRITSLQDGAVQHLDAQGMRQWQWTSAYFNGSAVKVELLGGKRGARFAIGKLLVGKTGAELAAARAAAAETNPESQCGATDDRVPSVVRYSGRLMSVGCTANLMASGCFTTAGHCVDKVTTSKVVEFNVPPSTASGAVVHPAPKDQYTVTSNRKSSWTRIGDDWGVFTTNANTETGLTALQAQGASLTFGATPAVGDTAQIDGYGVDSGAANQTLQVHSGPITSVDTANSILQYQADTEGGNSGSAVLVNGQMVAVHTNGGCSTSGSGANSGMLVNNAGFQAAVSQVCGSAPPDGPACSDISKMARSCKGGVIKVSVIMKDGSHNGQSVVINVDGMNHDTPITAGKAVLKLTGQSVGTHTTALTDPQGCYPARTVTCN